jgi:hypothetical protein
VQAALVLGNCLNPITAKYAVVELKLLQITSVAFSNIVATLKPQPPT